MKRSKTRGNWTKLKYKSGEKWFIVSKYKTAFCPTKIDVLKSLRALKMDEKCCFVVSSASSQNRAEDPYKNVENQVNK